MIFILGRGILLLTSIVLFIHRKFRKEAKYD